MSTHESLAIDVRNLHFAYPEGTLVLDGLSWQLPAGSFAIVTGSVGSGKSTLLRLLKPGLVPTGALVGERSVMGRELTGWSRAESAAGIGFVAQNPEAHIVCDTVEREIAFALENLGMSTHEMHRRVAGVAHFLGITPLVRRRCAELSAGELQAVAIAGALVSMPDLLLLDEPTSRLDPVATHTILHLLFRVNRELGLTVVLCTHAPELVAEYATCAFELLGGQLHELASVSCGGCTFGIPEDNQKNSPCSEEPLSGNEHVNTPGILSKDVSSGSGDMHQFSDTSPLGALELHAIGSKARVVVDDVHVRYERDEPEALRGVDLKLAEGEILALIGANGSGKTTLLKTVAGMVRPQRGRVRNRAAAAQAYLPQNPKALFVCDSVEDELREWQQSARFDEAELSNVVNRLGLGEFCTVHPYDLSGGQQQLLALAKLLLTKPDLLILDEPTQGVDPKTRLCIARELLALAGEGASVLMATHDLAFASRVAHQVALVFDGEIACAQPACEFFAHELFYQPRPDGFTRLFDTQIRNGEPSHV